MSLVWPVASTATCLAGSPVTGTWPGATTTSLLVLSWATVGAGGGLLLSSDAIIVL